MKWRKYTITGERSGLATTLNIPVIPAQLTPDRQETANAFKYGDDLRTIERKMGLSNLHQFMISYSHMLAPFKLAGAVYHMTPKKGPKIRIKGADERLPDPYLGTLARRNNGLIRVGDGSQFNWCHIGDDRWTNVVFTPSGEGDVYKGPYMGDRIFSDALVLMVVDPNDTIYQITIQNFPGHKAWLMGITTPYMDTSLRNAIRHTPYVEEEVKEEANMRHKWGDIRDRYSPTAGLSGVGIYAMTKDQVNALFRSLYTNTISESLKKFAGLLGDQNGAINSLTWYYHFSSKLSLAGNEYIQIYNQFLNKTSGEGVMGRRVESEYADDLVGEFVIEPKFGNFLDYTPYTHFILHVPMLGVVPLAANDIMGRMVRVRYRIDVARNTGLVFINVVLPTGEYNLKISPFTPGVEIPFKTSSTDARLMAGPILQAGGAMLGSVVGGPAGAAMGAKIGGGVGAAISSGASSTSAGGLSAGASHLDGFEIRLVRVTPILQGMNLKTLGWPVEKEGQIGQFSGFVKTGNITHFPGSCPYKDKIEELLKEGVFV